ncbi:MAG TPA: DUF420 domain-containing protein, partial [Panacibacter sp.]|nr:DUF420 domain-containing protein [Panacibacter sp.]
MHNLLQPAMQKNDRKAKRLIGLFSAVVFIAVAMLGNFNLKNVQLGFDVHVFAKMNAIINSIIAV